MADRGEDTTSDPLAAALERAERAEAALEVVDADRRRYRTLIERGSDTFLVVGPDAVITHAGPALLRASGLSPVELEGHLGLEFVHPADIGSLLEAFEEAMGDADRSPVVLVRGRHGDGSWHWIEAVLTNLTEDPDLGGLVVTCRDVTDRVQVQDALRASEARMEAVLRHSSDVVTRVAADGVVEFVSPAVRALLGFEPGELVGTNVIDWIHPTDQPVVATRLADQQARQRAGAPLTVRVRTKGGSWIPVEGITTYLRDDEGTLEAYLVNLRDVRWRIEAERGLRRSEERYRALVQHSSDAVVVLDPDGTVTFASDPLERLFGRPLSEVIGTSGLELLHPDDRLEVGTALAELLDAPGANVTREMRIRHADGSWRWVEATVVNLLDHQAVQAVVANVRDISERKELEARLHFAASHDPLTGLANRALVIDRLEVALERARRTRHMVAVLFVDLDGFKPINDSIGHDAGDRVLAAAAQRLATALRPGDTIGRWGGDEFVAVCEDLADEADALAQAELLRGALGEHITVDGVDVTLDASVGVAVSAGPTDAGDLVRAADTALYQAKGRGRGAVILASR